MTHASGRTLALFLTLILLTAACTESGTPQPVDVPDATTEPVVAPTSTSQPTMPPEPSATAEPTAGTDPDASAPLDVTDEASLTSPEFVLGDLATYQDQSTDLSFDYPADWIITAEGTGPIRIESEAGYGERVDTDAGAAVIIIPMAADDLVGQDSLEKLASYILSHEPLPSTRLGDPTTMLLNDQELTFSAFVDEAAGLEGVYAAILAGDELAVVFAIAGGDSRVSYRPAVEAIVNSLSLPHAE